MRKLREVGWRTVAALLAVAMLIASFAPATAIVQPASPSIRGDELVVLARSISVEDVMKHVEFFSSLGSRVSGYEGFYQAARYIKSVWGQYFPVLEEEFEVTVPVVHESMITVEIPGKGNLTLPAYPLWPNHVNPCPYVSPPSGDRIVYARMGDLEDYDGLDVKGSFVLLEFNNRWYWKYSLLYGAKGVVFIEPEDTISIEALQKVLQIPLNYPRLLIDRDAGLRLVELLKSHGSLRVWIVSRVKWETRRVSNIIAIVNGTSNPDEVAVVGAYYDSWSIVPQRSPGANDAIGISYLLEFARVLKANPPNRTVWLVAFAGHYQALAGAREFVDRHFGKLGTTLKMMITLDLSGDSDIVAAYAAGAMYGYQRPRDIIPQYSAWMDDIVSVVRALANATGEDPRFIDGVRWAWPPWAMSTPPFEPFLRYFEAEVFTKACYGGGLGLVTTNTLRKYQWTFMDTPDKINPVYLSRQFAVITPVIYYSINGRVRYSLYPRRVGAIDHGLVSVVLQLGKYNRTTNMFDDYAHPGAIFYVSVSPTMSGAAGIIAVGFQPAATVGSSQAITVPGVTVGLFAAPPPVPTGVTVGAAAINTPVGFTLVLKPDAAGRVELKSVMPLTGIDAQGYVLDVDTGRILSATDTGPFGTGVFRLGGLFGAAGAIAAPLLSPLLGGLGYLMEAGAFARAFTVQVPRGHRYVPIFNCSSIALVGFFDPLSLYGPQGLGIEVLNFISHSYLVWRDVLTNWPEAMVFFDPETPVEILIRSQGRIIAVLNNASPTNPNGAGYKLNWGDTKVLTPIEAVLGTYYLVNYRASFLESRMTTSPRLLIYSDVINEMMARVAEAEKQGRRSEVVKHVFAAWHFIVYGYDSTISLLFDVTHTATFFFFLSLIFALLASRFLGRVSGRRQTLVIIVMLLVSNAILSLVHPGYVISNNVWILIGGVSVALLLLLLLFTVNDELNTALSELSVSMLGFHKADIKRGPVAIASISMGIENLKKRPLRTALTLVTITATVTALVLFTSVSVAALMHQRSMGTAIYSGVLVRRPVLQLYMPIHEIYLKIFPTMLSDENAEFKAYPRAWFYPAGQNLMLVWSPNGSGIRCIFAITAEESRLLKEALEGAFFVPGSVNSVIMTKSLAERLSSILGYPVELGSEISIFGINVTVVGLLNKDIASFILSRDIDGYSIVPPDPISTGMAGTYTPFDLDAVVIVPYEFALRYLNSMPNMIRISTDSNVDEGYVASKARLLSLLLPFDTAYGVKGGSSYIVARRELLTFGGAENIIVPLTLAAMTIVITMLGAVYERRREIYTLTTVGAAPTHVNIVFLMEALTLAFIGSYIGYVTGASVLYIFWSLKALPPGLVPNVSSSVVIIVLAVIIAVTLLSALYPASVASRMATPSLLRTWTIETKPRAGTWEVTMPFSAAREEAVGILTFIREFLESYSSERERSRLFNLISTPQITREERGFVLQARLHMAPFDAGIIQSMKISAYQAAGGRYQFNVLLLKELGPESMWITVSRALIGELRKQFLAWRALQPVEKAEYIKKGLEEGLQ
ncbi:MAG: M28 family peptidase [Thermofilaceae archaeon]